MSDVLHVIGSSRTGSLNAATQSILNDTAYFMHKKGVALSLWRSSWLCFARKMSVLNAFKRERELFGTDAERMKVLILDDDVQILTPAQELSNILLESDQKGLNIVANYKAANGANLVFKSPKERYTDEDLRQLAIKTPFEKLKHDVGCIGFYYGDVIKSYDWHQSSYIDEVTYFFRENPDLNVHLATRIKLSHYVGWWRSTWENYDYVPGNEITEESGSV